MERVSCEENINYVRGVISEHYIRHPFVFYNKLYAYKPSLSLSIRADLRPIFTSKCCIASYRRIFYVISKAMTPDRTFVSSLADYKR